jgi:hypothetical protein
MTEMKMRLFWCQRFSNNAGGLLIIPWGTTLIVLLLLVLRYQYSVGAEAHAALQWPGGTEVSLASDRDTLLLFLHPKCPCSAATVEELSRLLAFRPNAAAIQIFYYRPLTASKGWDDNSLLASVRALPGVRVLADINGARAEQFGANTSGQVFLYSPDGRLLFSGGITGARAHVGDNAGLSAVQKLMDDPASLRAAFATTPVFGCALHSIEPGTSRGAR